MKRVGVLALQGSVQEHMEKLERIDGVTPVSVKSQKDLVGVERLIIPGGESTAIGKLLRDFDMIVPLAGMIRDGMPVWGTCAGMIILAKRIENSPTVHLNVMDITVKRNAYGSQLDSFVTEGRISEVSHSNIPLVFIRAPYITRIGEGVDVMLEVDGKIVATRQKNMIATSFHPELTDSLDFHRYFCSF
ncbi:MAG: Pyridoxal 5'-phosphate synthase (glutamine hydrolyzing), glutaminase subunit [Firmicutes bacterium]|nr:Pyridoxal 5'-phosphate synthase (glutamine hydrolyzing), glutaminase subunit [Bacillota bacterium]